MSNNEEIVNNNENQIISDEWNARVNDINKQLYNIELRQQEIQNYINHIDSNIVSLDTLLQSESDVKKSIAYRNAIAKNIELVSQLYSTYKEFEQVKYKYHQEIDNITQHKIKILHIDLIKLNKSLERFEENDFAKMLSTMNQLMNSNKLSSEKSLDQSPLINDSKYNL